MVFLAEKQRCDYTITFKMIKSAGRLFPRMKICLQVVYFCNIEAIMQFKYFHVSITMSTLFTFFALFIFKYHFDCKIAWISIRIDWTRREQVNTGTCHSRSLGRIFNDQLTNSPKNGSFEGNIKTPFVARRFSSNLFLWISEVQVGVRE